MAKLTDKEIELIRSSISDRSKTPDNVLIATLRAVLSGGMQNVDPELLQVFVDEINARGITADKLDESRRRTMRITESKLRRILRSVIIESRVHFPDPELEQDYVEYGSGTEFDNEVVLSIDKEDWPDFDRMEFEDFASEVGHVDITHRMHSSKGHILTITGSFDALWQGWVNCCGDDPYEFMNYVVQGEENCPELP
tara:strand:+ start:31 stop:621 length:591 start_codon:yes stop_codon:yes gene_type:complete